MSLHQYPEHFYRPFGGGGMALILLVGFILLAFDKCGGFLGC